MTTFEKNLAMGKVGEGVISRWLQSRGLAVFPAYEIEIPSGKGPQLFTVNGDFVLPDLLTFGPDGKTIWFEAKHKSRFTWHRTSKQWTTGIDLHHFEQYLSVQEITKTPVWLLFWHPNSEPSDEDLKYLPDEINECPTGLFGGPLDKLKEDVNHRAPPKDIFSNTGHGRHGMVYWSMKSLTLLASVEDCAG